MKTELCEHVYVCTIHSITLFLTSAWWLNVNNVRMAQLGEKNG